MRDFFRPEVRALIYRWREVLAALAVVLAGLWWGIYAAGAVRWIYLLIAALGLIWAIAAVQRARFSQGGDGAGVVHLRERRLAYYGPLDGGVMDVEDLQQLAYDPTSYPAASWVLTGAGGQRLAVPVNAAGADALFDVFAALPGMRTQALLDVLARTPPVLVVVWQRTRAVLH